MHKSNNSRVARLVGVCGLLIVPAVAAGAHGVGAAPAAAAVAVIDPSTVNVVQNGAFETGGAPLSPWIFRHDVAATLAAGTGDAVDGAAVARVHVAATSASAWLVQLRQEHIALQGANEYTLSFWAKASAPRVINARLQSSVTPYPTFVARDYLLTSTWQQFTLTYTAKADVADAFVGFNLAQAIGDVEIDNVSLTNSNLVVNGGFETGGATLSPWVWRNDIDATLTRDTTTVLDGTSSAKITVPTLGSAPHHVQLRQPIATVVSGASYRVSFAIRASRARTANVRVQSSDTPYPTVVSNNFSVTTAWTRVVFDWTPKVTVTNPFLGFNLAQDTGTIWLDDITLTRQHVAAGTVVGWGDNFQGQATPPAGLTGAIAIAAGYSHSLALRSDGTVVGWGDDGYGQTSPPAGLTGVVAISAGAYHSLALKSDGTVVGWGYSLYGQTNPPATLTGVVAISAGWGDSLALKSDGTVVGWGFDRYGQATPPAGLSGVVAISAGYGHSLALKSDGTVVGWGANSHGQTSPPAGLTGVTAIAAGMDLALGPALGVPEHSLALRSNGTVVGWGDNTYGESTPPAGLTGVIAISAGPFNSLALKSDGTVVGWGHDFAGETTPPAGLAGVIAIASGGVHSLALLRAR